MLFAPLSLALAALLAIIGVALQLVSMICGSSLALAFWRTAGDLIRTIP